MTYRKRFLALAMALVLAVSVMSMGVGAAFTDQDQIPYEEDVQQCVDLYIINGFPDGSFRPYNALTRAQMCKMLYVLSVGGQIPPAGVPDSEAHFKDTQGHWANAYIGACVEMGLVNGVGGNRFNPDGRVTANQEAKMLLGLLGYDANTEGYIGANWETNVVQQAAALHLYGDLITRPLFTPIHRAGAAHIIVNALYNQTVEYNENGWPVPTGELLIEARYGK